MASKSQKRRPNDSARHLRLLASNDRQQATEAGLELVIWFETRCNAFHNISRDLKDGNRVAKKRARREFVTYLRDIEREARVVAKKLSELNQIAKRPLFRKYIGSVLDLGKTAGEMSVARSPESTAQPRTE